MIARTEGLRRSSGTLHTTLSGLQKAAQDKCGVCMILAERINRLPGDVAEEYNKDPVRFKFQGHDSTFGDDNSVDFNGLGQKPLACLYLEYGYGIASRYADCVSFRRNRWRDDESPPPYTEFKDLVPTATNTGDDSVIQLARRWFMHCDLNHDKCGRTYNEGYKKYGSQVGWFPDRVLDLTGDHPRLLVTKDEKPIHKKYATLSHSWGPNPQQLTLTSENMESMRAEIPMTILQKTFRDAIKVAKALDIYYLWIDSLCIIQSGENSNTDWQEQAGAMSQIYSNGAVNISADHAKNANDGCFIDRDLELLKSVYFKRKGEDYVFAEEDINMQIFDLPLSQRGWVMQERLLSPRVLHFGQNQIYWECQETPFASEVFLGGLSTRESDFDQRPFNLEIPMIHGAPDIVEWSKIVHLYTTCALTFPGKDKFMALAAIAERYASVFDGEYCAGFFKTDFPMQLLWQVAGTDTNPASVCTGEYRAPTWSWMNIDGPVKMFYISGDSFFSGMDLFNGPDGRPIDYAQYNFTEMKDLQIELVNPENKYGPIKSAQITLEGQLFSDAFLEELRELWDGKDSAEVEDKEKITLELVMDLPLSLENKEMPLLFPFGLHGGIHGLCLKLEGESSNRTYSRLGYFKVKVGNRYPYNKWSEEKEILGQKFTVVLI